MKTYKSYVFKNKDPVIDELRTIAQGMYGDVKHKTLAQIERNGGPTASCMSGWFHGATKRPSSSTVEAAGRAMGYKRKWVKSNN